MVGHTKNDADRFFNLLKMSYRKKNIFTMDMMCEVLGTSDKVRVHRSYATKDFKDFDKFFGGSY